MISDSCRSGGRSIRRLFRNTVKRLGYTAALKSNMLMFDFKARRLFFKARRLFFKARRLFYKRPLYIRAIAFWYWFSNCSRFWRLW